MIRGWTGLNNEEFRNLCFSSNKITIIKSKIRKLTEHVARKAGESHTQFWLQTQRKKDRFNYIDTDGNIILKWNLKIWDRAVWTELYLAQDRGRRKAIANAVMKLRAPQDANKFSSTRNSETGSFPRNVQLHGLE
jgi:hypothetical protein